MENRVGLNRFLEAQENGQAYSRALSEIEQGRKETHWMWFVLPQLAGLGQSPMAQLYAISDLDEARLYLDHAVLGTRLVEICNTLLALETSSAFSIFGHPDHLKLRSCMTLFSIASGAADNIFSKVMEKYFPDGPDHATLQLLESKR